MVARPGFEPGPYESKSHVLPLHYRATKKKEKEAETTASIPIPVQKSGRP